MSKLTVNERIEQSNYFLSMSAGGSLLTFIDKRKPKEIYVVSLERVWDCLEYIKQGISEDEYSDFFSYFGVVYKVYFNVEFTDDTMDHEMVREMIKRWRNGLRYDEYDFSTPPKSFTPANGMPRKWPSHFEHIDIVYQGEEF